MPATLRLTHKSVGAEVRRGRYEAIVDGTPSGTLDMNQTIDIEVQPGPHTIKLRSGRQSSPITTFNVAEGEVASFRCTGKSILPVFLLSFIVPSLALNLKRE